MEKTNKPILVIGGGISGITAAVEIAEVGKEVIIVEKESFLGGNVVKMNSYFPKLCPPTCGLEINYRRIKQNSRISYHTSTEVIDISGEKKFFSVKLRTAPLYIKKTCTACGKCTVVCPEERPDEFNYKMSKTKAVYLAHDMAFPMLYNIDDNYCKKQSCNKCVEACEYNAIDLSAKETEQQLEVGSIITATGWKNYKADAISNLNYANSENIVSNVEMERLLAVSGPENGKLSRLSGKNETKDIVFVQCAGSRDENHLPYCSAVCCSASLKHALNIQEKYPETHIKIFYIDLRVSGRNEDFLKRAQDNKNIELIKGKIAKIEENKENGKLVVEAEDILSGKKIKSEANLVVLATGIVPTSLDLGLEKNKGGFLIEAQKEGIYPIACVSKPMDVSASVKNATGVALKAIQNNN